MRMAGAIRRRLSRRGELEYRVIESRIAPTLRRKSTANASTVYGSKKDWRAWRTDHRIIATCNNSKLATIHAQHGMSGWNRGTNSRNGCNIIDFCDRAAREIGHKVLLSLLVAPGFRHGRRQMMASLSA